jgi:hypothetical protein
MRRTPRISHGTCALCHETFAKSAVGRHLAGCLARHPTSDSVPGFHLVVEGAGVTQYWMHLAARASATLGDLDDFLRLAWLDCCSHCSAFTIAGRRYDVTDDGEGGLSESALGMRTRLVDVLLPRLAFGYEYDFGSTTELALRVVAELPHMPRGKAIQLLALNDAPSYPCSVCGKPAQVIDLEGDRPLCKTCAKDNATEDMVLPLVNSPRTGVCAYAGPVIDVPKGKARPARRGTADA